MSKFDKQAKKNECILHSFFYFVDIDTFLIYNRH